MDAIRAAAHAAAHAALMRGRRHIGEFLGGFQTWKMTTTISRGGGARPARGGARRRRDAAFDPVEARARLRRAGFAPAPRGFGARDDDLEDLLAAGIDVRPPWLGPGHGPGLGPNEGLLPGENPEGVLGPLRRARAERREREAAERAARAGRAEHVDLLADENSPAAGHAAGPAGGRRRIRDGEGDEGDVCDLTKSPAVDAGAAGDRDEETRRDASGTSRGAAKGARQRPRSTRRWPWWISRDADVSIWDWEEEEEEYPGRATTRRKSVARVRGDGPFYAACFILDDDRDTPPHDVM